MMNEPIVIDNILQFIEKLKILMNGKNYRKINDIKYYYHCDKKQFTRFMMYNSISGQSHTIMIGSDGAYYYYINGNKVNMSY